MRKVVQEGMFRPAATARPDRMLSALGDRRRLQVEHQQRHRDREHAIAQRCETIEA